MTEGDRILQIVEQFVADLRAGRTVDADAVAARHPDLGPPLEAALRAAGTIAALGRARAARRLSLALRPLPPTRYDGVAFVDQGGMGIIYRVHDASLDRDVALKTLPAGLSSTAVRDPATADLGSPNAARQLREAARFRREARLTAALEHPGVPPVYEVGEAVDGTPYYAMRLVARDGRTLAAELAHATGRRFEHRIPLLEAFLRVCDTVAYAHSKGIVHRDLKPENVVIGDYGVVFVVDWGLAAWRREGEGTVDAHLDGFPAPKEPPDRPGRLTERGRVLGTPGYHSPEAATGDMSRVDERSEVFSLGVMLFEVLTGTLPFPHSTRAEYAERVRAAEPIVAIEVDPTIPPALSNLCRHALARDPALRPVSVTALAEEVRAWRARSDADREAIRLIGEAQTLLMGVSGFPLEDARRKIDQARALVASVPSLVAAHPRVSETREACDRASMALEQAEQRRVQELQARRRRRQRWTTGAIVVILGALAFVQIERSREQGRSEAQEDAVRQKRATIEATIAEMDRAGLGTSGRDLEYLLRLVRDADAATVDVISDALDRVTDELAAVRDRVLLEPAVDGRTLAERIAQAQMREVSTGRRRRSYLLCEALGHIRIVERAVPSLGRYLRIQHDSDGTTAAGVALARLASSPRGGEDAVRTLQEAAATRDLSDDPSFRSRVLAYLPLQPDGAPPRPLPTAPPVPAPRRVHGALKEPVSGADWLVPAYVESWIGLGLPLDNRREVRDDLQALSRRIEAAPREAAGWLNRAEARRLAGDLSGAEADLTRAIELAPLDAIPRERRASARRLGGDHFGALDDYHAALAITKDRTRVLLFRGITWVDLGDGARAIEDLDAAIALDPTLGAAYSYRAMARINLRDFEGAERDALRATRTIPDNSEAWNALVVARLMLGRPAEAHEAARAASAEGAPYYLGWNSLGVARFLAGDREGARVALRTACGVDARLPFAWTNLGVCDLAQGSPRNAARAFEAAIERGGARLGPPWLGLALACRASGDSTRARTAMETFRILTPDDPRAVDPEAFVAAGHDGR